jgi:pimeloyl-ACP methyl ester carboxylesterase
MLNSHGKKMNPVPLPKGINSRVIEGVNGASFHILESGHRSSTSKSILLIHGFPELAFSWRKVMIELASQGYYVIAPDVRGYGRSSGAGVAFQDDLRPFSTLNKIQDMLALIAALGRRRIDAVVGHDQGSSLAGWCALSRPDIFKSVVMMSSPFPLAPVTFPFDTETIPITPLKPSRIAEDLALLNPPRKYYQHYYASEQANWNMLYPQQGLHSFLRAYYHFKSADWKGNNPFPLKELTALEWEKLPRYYVMDLHQGMAESVLSGTPSQQEIEKCKWLTEDELMFYTQEYSRTGFQGGLQGYRLNPYDKDLAVFAGQKINVPSMFIGGKNDWGNYQTPGGLERLETEVTTQYQGTYFVEGAGHWVQQEKPQEVCHMVLEFLKRNSL